MKKLIQLLFGLLCLFAGYFLYQTYFQSPETLSTESPVSNYLTIENPDIQTLLKEADDLKKVKQYPQAGQKLAAAYQLDKSSNLALIAIAEIYFEIDNLKLAKTNLQLAKDKGKLNYQGQILDLKINLYSQEVNKARDSFNQIELNTNYKFFLGTLINLLTHDLSEAENKLNFLLTSPEPDAYTELAKKLLNVINLYRTFAEAPEAYQYTLTAKELLDSSDFLLARPFLLTAIQKQNNYRDAWLMLGYSYLLSGKNQDATKALTRAKQIDPQHPQILFYLGLAQQKTAQTKQSIHNFTQASVLGFRNPQENSLKTANSLFLKGAYAEANQLFTQIRATTKLSLEDYTKLVWANLEPLQNPQEALKISLESLQHYPKTPMAENLAGWSYLHLENHKKAMEHLKNALRIDPSFEAPYLNLGVLAIKENRLLEAETLLNKAIELAQQNRAFSIQRKAQEELQTLQKP